MLDAISEVDMFFSARAKALLLRGEPIKSHKLMINICSMITTWIMGGSASRELQSNFEQCNRERRQLQERKDKREREFKQQLEEERLLKCGVDKKCLKELIRLMEEVEKTKMAVLERTNASFQKDPTGNVMASILTKLESFQQEFLNTKMSDYCELSKVFAPRVSELTAEVDQFLLN